MAAAGGWVASIVVGIFVADHLRPIELGPADVLSLHPVAADRTHRGDRSLDSSCGSAPEPSRWV